MDSESHIIITAGDVLNSLKETKLGKCARIDRLANEHFIHFDVSITVHLSLLFSSMSSHRFSPDAFMQTLIIPILKKKMVTQMLKVTTGQ